MFASLRRVAHLALAVIIAASAIVAAPGHARLAATTPVDAVVIDGIVFTLCQSGRPADGDRAPVSAHTQDCVLCTLATGLTPDPATIVVQATVFAARQTVIVATYWPETTRSGLGARAPPALSA